MPVTYLKQAAPRPVDERADLRDMVQVMLATIEQGGEQAVRDYAQRLDGWTGDIVVSAEERAAAADKLPEVQKADIRFAHDNIRRFAKAQRASITDMQVELIPGHWAGQRQIPVSAAGCYVPGGRYAHVASALMTITTARAAGVGQVIAASPPRRGQGIPPAVLYAMGLAGADVILNLGGVQAIAAMKQGLFGTQPADILVGPGNAYVAEAKRMCFGEVGIDMFAGPTDTLVIADDSADAEVVAWDLVGQAEHGPDSPVWLITDSRKLAQDVMQIAPRLIETLPETNAAAARMAWADRAEVILCDTREEMAQMSDRYAPEHLQVMARDLDWWKTRLSAYGSLFLGHNSTVPFGDKVSGPNHVLPTSGAARYTGGLSVAKFLKTVTWQHTDEQAMRPLAEAAARISRLEGMEGHARSAEIRLEKSGSDRFKIA